MSRALGYDASIVGPEGLQINLCKRLNLKKNGESK